MIFRLAFRRLFQFSFIKPRRPASRQVRNFTKLRMSVLEDRTVPTAAYALSGTNLLSFDTATPTTTTSIAITGVPAFETLVGIDVRPQNGYLYGLGVDHLANTSTLYAISARTGVAGVVGTASQIAFVDAVGAPVDLPDPATAGYGFDFNPSADRVRVVTSTGLNFRVDPNTGRPADGNLNLMVAPPETNPDGPVSGVSGVDGTAYTNNIANNGSITTQYTISSATRQIFVQNPPNSGAQTLPQNVTLNGNPLNFTAVNGFDIPVGVNAAASNAAVTSGSAFAVLNVGGVTSLYSINLVNGQATVVGNVGDGATAVQGFTVFETPAVGTRQIVALSADGLNLQRFRSDTPTTVTPVAIDTTALAVGEQMVGIDFRPRTGQLIGLAINATTNAGSVYIVDPQTGALTRIGAAGAITYVDASGTTVDLPLPSAGYGFDFNPTVDRIRITTETGLNFRINPVDGTPVDGNLALTPNPAGVNPDGPVRGLPAGSTGVGATAYTNSFGQAAGVTTQYTLDAGSNSLFIQNPPNDGTQTNQIPIRVNGSPLDFVAINGFDIPSEVTVTTGNSPVVSGYAFAVLTVGTSTQLYVINLVNGNATAIGNVNVGATGLAGLALGDAPPVPTPTVTLTSTNVTLNENSVSNSTTITLTRSGPTTLPLEVQLSQSLNGASASDFTLVAGSGATFDPVRRVVTFGVGSANASLTFTAVNDIQAEGVEQVTFTVVDTPDYNLGTTVQQVVTINFNDTVVTNRNQSGEGSVRQAIANANAIPGPNTITFEGSIFTDATPDFIILTYLRVTETGSANALTITGPNAAPLFFSGNLTSRPLFVEANAFLNLSNVSIIRGNVVGVSSGAGLYNAGTTNLSQVTFNNNFAPGLGGAIYNSGTLSLDRVTISGNRANRLGGGIYTAGTLTVTRSTIANNRSNFDGGSTSSDRGGGLATTTAASTTLNSTIVARNFFGTDFTTADDIVGSIDTGSRNNLIGTGGAGGLTNGTNENLVGIVNPLLAPLADYGGLQFTHALLPGSPALNSGATTNTGTDQRGSNVFNRPDIGAFESQGFTLAIVAGDNQSSPINAQYASNLVVSVTANDSTEPVNGGQVSFTRPATGASLTYRVNPIRPTIVGGRAQIFANANGTAGAFDVIASVVGGNSVTFDLTNTASS